LQQAKFPFTLPQKGRLVSIKLKPLG